MANETYLNFAGFQCLENLNHSTLDMYLTTCGIQNCFGGHRFGPGKRDSYILHFVSDGKGIFKCDGVTYELTRGDVFLVKPDTEVYYIADENNPWSYMWVGFNGIKAAAYLEAAGLLGKVVTTKCSNTPIIFSCIQQMIMYRQLTLANELKREAALLQILSIMMEEYKGTLPKEERYDYPYQIYVDQAVDYIQRNFKSNIKVNDLASYIGIDRSYLTNIFKKVTTLSPQEYLMNYRMEQAKNMLSGSEMKIGEIAEKVGYHDQLTFSKMFKKFVGISPTEYREKE
ncbi:MAG: AraC family transcriptional regulator [Lachnospiraceae bacterium]|nr:AraC family transcriptional regulator [Lachnospiraceae bacterium]